MLVFLAVSISYVVPYLAAVKIKHEEITFCLHCEQTL